ncbi:MAG: hypothetical protein IJJ45_06860 [Clostridia bacterium]|nr:hypothetical protein [Clostridia bacterium]
MSKDLYELIALGARYFFAALMVLIVARAWRITLVDSRRARTLRRLSPETGIAGEMVVIEGDEKARKGMRYPVTLEGMLGTSRRADIRIRHSSVRRRHAWFQMTPEGLSLRAHAHAPMRLAGHAAAAEMLLRDGDVFDIGRVRLMLVLSVDPETAGDAPRVERRRAPQPEADDLFALHPLLDHAPDPDAFEPGAGGRGEVGPDGGDGAPEDLFFDD